MVLPLAIGLMGNLAVTLFVLTCMALILIVLLQKGRGGGLGAAFGGGGAGSLLGTKTGDVLTWITICLVAFFLVLAVLLGKFLRPKGASDLGTPMQQATTSEAVETEAAQAAAETIPDVAEQAADDLGQAAQDIQDNAAAAAEEVVEDVAAEVEDTAESLAGEEASTH